MWKRELRKCLSKPNAQLDSAQIKTVLAKYDGLLAQGHSEQESFEHIMETFASEETSVAVNRVKAQHESFASSLCVSLPESEKGQFIRESLQAINKDNTVETNTTIRLKKAIRETAKNFNRNIHKLDCTLVSQFTRGCEVSILNESDVKALVMQVAKRDSALKMEYESFAAFKVGRANLQ